MSVIYSKYNYRPGQFIDIAGVEWNSILSSIGLTQDFSFYLNPKNTIYFGLSAKYYTYRPGYIEAAGTESVFNDDLINGNYLNGIYVQSLLAKLGNRVPLKMASITEEYYEYCLAIVKETAYADGPFESAPASIHGNVNNGVYGFFTTLFMMDS